MSSGYNCCFLCFNLTSCNLLSTLKICYPYYGIFLDTREDPCPECMFCLCYFMGRNRLLIEFLKWSLIVQYTSILASSICFRPSHSVNNLNPIQSWKKKLLPDITGWEAFACVIVTLMSINMSFWRRKDEKIYVEKCVKQLGAGLRWHWSFMKLFAD